MKTLLVLVLMIVCPIIAICDNDGITVNMKIRKCSWGDINLSDRLDMYMSTIDNIPIKTNEIIHNGSSSSFQTSTFRELLASGKESGDDFVVDVVIDRIDLEKRKVSIFPRIISRYRVYAVISGTLRIVDVDNEQLVKMKDIEVEFKTKDRWQVVDDNPDDPGLHISADRKLIIMRELEDRTAEELYLEIIQLAQEVEIQSEG